MLNVQCSRLNSFVDVLNDNEYLNLTVGAVAQDQIPLLLFISHFLFRSGVSLAELVEAAQPEKVLGFMKK